MKHIGAIGLIIFTVIQAHARILGLVTASDTNECLFSATCQLQPFTSLSSEFSLDGNTSTGRLETRVFQVTNSASPALGLYVYLFSLQLTNMTGSNCVQGLGTQFGPLVEEFDYNGDSNPGDSAFVNHRIGDPGTFGPTHAVVLGNRLTFVFDDMCPPNESYFLGVVSTNPPVTKTVIVSASSGEATADGLAPGVPTATVFANLRAYISDMSQLSLKGRKERAREQRRRSLIAQVNRAEKLFNRGNLRAATAQMNTLVRRTDGIRPGSDWVVDDAATTDVNELAELNELARQAVNALDR